jgi:hypothetical protein
MPVDSSAQARSVGSDVSFRSSIPPTTPGNEDYDQGGISDNPGEEVERSQLNNGATIKIKSKGVYYGGHSKTTQTQVGQAPKSFNYQITAMISRSHLGSFTC